MNTVPGPGGAANLFSGLSAQQLAALSGVLGGQSTFSQAQLAALTNSSLSAQLNNVLASVAQQQPVAPVQNATPLAVENKTGATNGVSTAVPDLSLTSLPWPVVSPIMNVPHFDLATYRLVNLDVAPSRDVNGFDLPLADVTTLRFFFNLGVQHSRSLAATQLYQEKLAHVAVSSASASVAQPTQTSLPHGTQLGGVNILSEAQIGGPRTTMDQYINQLGIGSPQAQALLRQAQSHHLAQQAQLLAAAASVRLPDRPHPTYGNSILPLHADLLQLASQIPISVSAAIPGGQVCYIYYLIFHHKAI
ncbi:unnamed protein product [Strongylus vulgaris]|uniref:Uncharacterized protein n=1 Tax=Strongylus vulgaris TaxID=40348 RepID=A0A3P7ITX0_STRVU|nr:unnamed protein product [Strongylus vulgaris]